LRYHVDRVGAREVQRAGEGVGERRGVLGDVAEAGHKDLVCGRDAGEGHRGLKKRKGSLGSDQTVVWLFVASMTWNAASMAICLIMGLRGTSMNLQHLFAAFRLPEWR
jgi:hypothetical protein